MPASKRLKQAFATALGASLVKAHTFTDAAGQERTAQLRVLPVLPASPFRTVDSRRDVDYSYDAAALIAAHRVKGRALPIDIDHATEFGRPDTRARGWVVDMTTADESPDLGLEPGVLYALCEMTPLGEQELADKLYGYTSGVALGTWVGETACVFSRIRSLALTNTPATEMPMAFTAEDDEDGSPDAGYTEEQTSSEEPTEMPLEKLRELLGLPADADVAAIDAAIAALTAAMADATTTAALTAESDERAVALTAAQEQLTTLSATVATLTAERDEARTALATAQAAEAERVVLCAVEDAVRAGKLTPAQRDQALVIARANLEAFAAFVAAAPVVVDNAASRAPALDEAHGLTAEQLSHCKTHGIDPAIFARNLRTA